MKSAKHLAVGTVLVSLLAGGGPAWAHRGGGGRGGGMGWLAGAYRAQAAWLARERAAEAARQAKTNPLRMKYADKARKDGKPWLAATLYLRVVRSRPVSPYAGAARKGLVDMAAEGKAEMEKAEKLLADGKIAEGFKQLDHLAWAYENVPKFNEEIAHRVRQLHNEPKYEAALNEPQAAEFLKEALDCERTKDTCCAFVYYEEAAKLLPAESAKKADARLDELKKDSKLVAEAAVCRKLHECDHHFYIAEMLSKSSPGKAAELFKKVADESPPDSEIHRKAREEYARLLGK